MTGELVKDILGAVPSLWEQVAAIRAAWINRNGFLYAYQAEVGLNLDLLAAVKRDSLAGVSAGSPAFAALVNSLETGAGLALLAGNDRRNYRRLVKLLKKHYAGGGSFNDDEDNSRAETVEGVLAAVSFSVRKIEALKRIVYVAERDAPFFPVFNLRKRLDNIDACLLNIAQCLAVVMSRAEDKTARARAITGAERI
jgi:hypothetical protein